MRRLCLLVSLASLAGCVSYSSFKEARALDPGTLRLDVAPAFIVTRPKIGATAFLAGGRPSSGDTSEQPHDGPVIELQLRYGVVRGFDLGVKTSLTSAELNATIEVFRGRSVEVALAPAAQVALGTNGDDEGWKIGLFKLPVLVGVPFGDRSQHSLVLGLALAKSVGGGEGKNSGYAADALLGGASIGVSLLAGESLRVAPEIAVYTPLSGKGLALPGDVLRVSPDVGFGRPVLVQAGVAFAFGSGR